MRCTSTLSLLALLVCACRFDPAGLDPGATDDDARVDAPSLATDARATDAPACADLACEFTRRRLVSIDVTRITAELTDIPVHIALDDTRIDYAETQDGGRDLRFFSYDLSTALAYEIESWNPGGVSIVWLRIPTLAPDSAPHQLWMYHGNATASPGQDPSAVWSDGFVSVHHFASAFRDSTAAGRNGVPNDAPSATTGPIGDSYSFDGDNDYVLLPDEPAYDFTDQMSVSAWFRIESFDTGWQALVTKGDYSWRLHRDGGNDRLALSTTHDGDVQTNHAGATDVVDGQWHHALGTYDGSAVRLYIDGMLDADSSFNQTLNNNDRPVFIGENADQTGRHFNGDIDEVRIANVPRSPDWALVEYLSVTDSTFITFGPEEAL